MQTPETPLSERGAVQARRLAERLAGLPVGRILTSDLTRAAMTAEVVRAHTRAPLALEPLLQERNLGDVRGTPYSDLGVDIFAPDYAPPRGETWDVFHARVDRAWLRVQAALDETAGHLVVVTHGLVCLSLSQRHLSLPSGAAPERSGFANTSLTVVEPGPPFVVSLYNCTAHLDAEQEGSQGTRL